SAGQLMRIALQPLPWRWNARIGKQLSGAFKRFFSRYWKVRKDRASDLLANRHNGIERGHCILENRADMTSPDLLQSFAIELAEALATERNCTTPFKRRLDQL